MKKVFKIGTRGSKLALWQAGWIREKLARRYPDLHFSIETIKTTGDQSEEKQVDQIGGKGVFVKEIEDALLNHQIDLAVHSAKDMAASPHPDLVCPAYLGEVSRGDILLLKDQRSLEELPEDASIGTGSNRRIAQLKLLRPSLNFQPVRGNIDTRIRKLKEGLYDGIVLAQAGIERLGINYPNTLIFSVDQMVPAGGQGIIAVQTHRDKEEWVTKLKSINQPKFAMAANIEFGILKTIQADCLTPVGVYMDCTDNIHVTCFYSDLEMTCHIRLSEPYPKTTKTNTIIEDFSQKMNVAWREASGKALVS